MKPKGYTDGGSKTNPKTNTKAPIPKVTRKKLKNIVKIDVDKTSKKLTQKQKIAAAIKAGTLKPGDVNEMTEYDMKQFLKGNSKGTFKDITGDGKVTKKDILKARGVPGFSRGGGMAVQGLGFKGVR